MSDIEPKPNPKITEPEARAAYLAMAGGRSLNRLYQSWIEAGSNAPGLSTLREWSRHNDWVRLAAEHDAKVAAAASEQIVQEDAETVVGRARIYRELAEESAQKALDTVKGLKPEELKASDARALSEISERAGKMAELLSGRATERTDNMTQDKLDALMSKMQKEADERISRAGAITRH